MHEQKTPSPWMVRHAQLVQPGSSLLDVACGRGRHAKFFAQHGALVTAVDIDEAALASFRGFHAIVQERRDLEKYGWPYAPESFDCIVVCNYLWRPIAMSLLASIKPGGLLLYETFMDGNERFGSPSRQEHLLRANELLQWIDGSFDTLATEQNYEFGSGGLPFAKKQKIAATKHGVKLVVAGATLIGDADAAAD